MKAEESEQQKAIRVIVAALEAEERAEIRLSIIGLLGLGLIGGVGYLWWRRR